MTPQDVGVFLLLAAELGAGFFLGRLYQKLGQR
jgi:hypothetical protein